VKEPFVLLDDASGAPGAQARFYRDPVEIVTARTPAEVRAALERLRRLDGLHAAGMLAYEAGFALEPRLAPLALEAGEGDLPLLWFGLFESCDIVPAAAIPSVLPDPAGAWTTPARPLVEQADYEAGVGAVKAHIEAGDIYQANLSFAAELRTAGHPAAIYARLRARARAGHGALLFTGEHWLLSLSPELFFTLEKDRFTARPMKGTAARLPDPAADRAEAAALREDPKQRAENLMIVDLLRNDLSRVSRPGSVTVPALFEVETYPTVHQLTSTVTSELAPGLGPVDALQALFPCGSITGAPKIRAMEIIAGLERRVRGAYTGSIGRIDPNGDAAFNVAIRTLTLRDGGDRAALGLGAGIVADSRPADEWRECLAKGAFVSSPPRFDLIETMRFEPVSGIAELERHLERMKASADALGFRFDRHDARNELQAATFRLRDARKVRLRLSPTGRFSVEIRWLPDEQAEPVTAAVAPLPVEPHDFRLRHKTSDRRFYDEARRRSGCFELLFRDRAGRFTEGSFTHLFVERDGRLVTPPLARGLLPGVLRARLLESGEAVEGDITELPPDFLIGNQLRGLMRARLATESLAASEPDLAQHEPARRYASAGGGSPG
jgi:para-aminobenzoate synthetase / 4-amino-4-deoxychorismate lyase